MLTVNKIKFKFNFSHQEFKFYRMGDPHHSIINYIINGII
jgi:hypothetical protein